MSPKPSPDRPAAGNTPTSGKPSGLNRWRRILLIALGIVVGIGVIVRVAAPEILRQTAIRQAPQFINGHIELENIDLSVLLGRLELDGLAVYADQAPEVPLFRIQKFSVDIGWGPLLEGHLHVQNVLLERPEINFAVNAEGRLNWENLALPGEEGPQEPENEKTSHLAVRVDGASIRDAQVQFSDLQKSAVPPVTAQLGSLHVAGFDLVRQPSTGEAPSGPAGGFEWGAARLDFSDWRIGLEPKEGEPVELLLSLHSEGIRGEGDPFPFELKVESDTGEIELNAEVALTPLSANGTLVWTKLVLPSLLRLAPLEGLGVKSGESEGNLKFSIESTPQDAARGDEGEALVLALSIAGKLGVRTLDLDVAGPSALSASWETLDVEVEKLLVAQIGGEGEHSPTIDVSLSKVELAKPNFEFVLAKSATSPPEESSVPAQDESQPGKSPVQQNDTAAPVKVGLAALKISDGALRFEDQTLEAPFKYNIGELEVAASDLHWPAATVSQLDLHFGAGGSRPVRLNGAQGAETGQFKLEVDELPLLPFNPYAKKLGVLITQGTVSLKSDVALTGLRYKAKNDVTFDSLSGRSIGKTFTKYFGVPLDVAITLLEDPFGKIKLVVPLNGDSGSGGMAVLRAVGTAFRLSLTNALATPIKMLAATVLPKSDASRLTFTLVPFDSGQTTLSEYAVGQLENYAQVLSSTGEFYANLWPQVSFGDARHLVPDLKWKPGQKKIQVDSDHPGYAKLLDLSNSRARAVASRLKTQFAVPEDKIDIRAWTGVLIDGPAGVRIGFSDGKLKRSLLKRATDRLKELF